MAEKLDRKEIVTLQEMALSNAYEMAALLAILERKGLVTQQEVLAEINRMKKQG